MSSANAQSGPAVNSRTTFVLLDEQTGAFLTAGTSAVPK